MGLGIFRWLRSHLPRPSRPPDPGAFERFVAGQARRLVAGAPGTEVVEAFEREVARLDDPFVQGMWRYNFAQWLIGTGLHEPVFHQLELSASLFARVADPVQGWTGMALVQALQSKCHGFLDAPAALHAARRAVESVLRAHHGPHLSRPGLAAARALHGTLGDDELMLAIVCARYATARLLQPAPAKADVLAACRWLLLAIECRLAARDLPPLSVLAEAECAEALTLAMEWRSELSLDDPELDALDAAEERLFSDERQPRPDAATPAGADFDLITFLQATIRLGLELSEAHRERLAAIVADPGRANDPVGLGGSALVLGSHEARHGDAARAAALLATAWEVLGSALPPGHLWRGEVLRERAALLERIGDAEGAEGQAVQRIAELTLWGRPMDVAAAQEVDRLSRLWSTSNPPASLFLAKLDLAASAAWFRRLRGIHPWLDELNAPGYGTVRDLATALTRAGRLGEAQEVLDWGLALSVARAVAVRTTVRPLSARRLSFTPLERAQAERLRAVVCTPACAFEPHLQRTRETVGSVAAVFAREEERYREEAARLGEAIATHQLERFPGAPGVTAVVRYLVGPDETQVLLLTPSGSISASVPIDGTELNQRAFDFRDLVSRPPVYPDSWDDHLLDARTLYDRLFPQAIRERLERDGVSRLVVGAAGALRFIPFAALHDGAGYLAERFSLVRIPETWVDLRQVPKPLSAIALLGSSAAAGHAALPAVNEELDAIRRIAASAGAASPLDLRDAAFGVAGLQGALNGSFAVVHIASHFNAVPADAARSSLLLGTGQPLALEEIERLAGDLREVDLLVLSACTTGLPTGGSESAEWSSPASLFHALGARSLLTTLWRVNDRMMSRLMQRWYEGMFAEGLDKAEALRQAQVGVLNGGSDAEKVHPWLWAGVEISGNWMPFPGRLAGAAEPTARPSASAA